MSESLYDILGVSRTATDAEIKKAYRRLARKHHPDVNPGDPEAEERFQKISAAYDVLGDPKRRALYDEFGEDSTRVGFDPEQARAHKRWQEQTRWRPGGQRARKMDEDADLFEALFGARRRGPARGPDIQAELTTDFMTAALGGRRTLTFSDGRTLDVRIPPGVDDGGSIRLRGKGGPGRNGGPPGDLIITLRVQPHPVFRREGLDLHIDLPITVVEAVRGADIEVPTLDGRVVLKVPPGSQSGQTLRIRDRGVRRKDRPPGHLFAHLIIQAPDGAVDDETLDKLARAYRSDPRRHLWEVQP
ncbi:MAG: J domain-containing protein [Deltaproteobacteria bacterium]|nr:MAG: J domain-containing protein [Deltaproteobacteria bacterium]